MRPDYDTELPPPETLPPQEERRARLIAFYLPQFHPIPENDAWWGKGFTEWTNVAKAKPLFRGHYQPHLPADLGFYDLRLPEAREAQALLARQYGIHGFSYYHYWFHGKRLIERPFQEVLDSGKPAFPFCLCWANEPWSRNWLGLEREVLMPQSYSEDDHEAHARWLCRAFADPRHIRVNGRPVFLIYRSRHIPNLQRALEIYRTVPMKEGLSEPYLIGVDAHDRDADFRAMGYDHALAYEPALRSLRGSFVDRWAKGKLMQNLRQGILSGQLKVYDYREGRQSMRRGQTMRPRIPSVLVGFDNTARRGRNGIILHNAPPEAFGKELRHEMKSWIDSKPEVDLFFINAWNEWAEGNHLEPDQRYGRGFLEQVKSIREEFFPSARLAAPASVT